MVKYGQTVFSGFYTSSAAFEEGLKGGDDKIRDDQLVVITEEGIEGGLVSCITEEGPGPVTTPPSRLQPGILHAIARRGGVPISPH